ncbi:MAG: response regulator [Elusimicrobiota bacterium]|jgi:diguanylate cyclase (GGDEF)-like protein
MDNESKLRASILVVDDEKDILRMLQEALGLASYDVRTAFNGEEAIEEIRRAAPDLVLMDIQMPKIDGLEVCRLVKSDVCLRHIPILLLTAQNTTRSKVRGLQYGADDYLTKPFEMDELLARVQMLLRRSRIDLEANPLTRLPGNIAIENEIMTHIREKTPFAVLYLDLNDFKAFNDVYGFVKGDEVIQETAQVIREVAETENAFVGHIGGDDFIVITRPDRFENICRKIIEVFDEKVPQFYNPKDRTRGYIMTKDRRGQETRFALLSVAIGVVTNQYRSLSSLGEISTIGAEMKHFAKENKGKGSQYAVDRRRE